MKFLRLLALLLPLCALAQETLPDPNTLTPADWYAQLRDAHQRGHDRVVYRLFSRDAPPPPESVSPYRYYTDLARAALDCGWFPGVHHFIRMAGTPPAKEPDLRWLSGLAYLLANDIPAAHRIVDFYQGQRANHPVACYLQAVEHYLEWRRLGPLHPEAADHVAEARKKFEIASDGYQLSLVNTPRDDRWYFLQVSLAEFEPGFFEYEEASRIRREKFPKNLAFLRDHLAASGGRFYLAGMEDDLAAARLTTEERAMWNHFSGAVPGEPLPALPLGARFARLPSTPEFAAARRHCLRTEFKAFDIIARVEAWHVAHPASTDPATTAARSAAYRALAAEFGPDYPGLLTAYVRLAAESENPADCYYALRLMDAHLTLPDADRAAFAPAEITLSATAGDRPRALALVKAQADARAQDLPWWRQHARLMENHAELMAAFIYFRHLAMLQPDNLQAQFALLGIADRDVHYDLALLDAKQRLQISLKFLELPPDQQENHPLALLASPDQRETAYGLLFKQVPARGVPATRHWENYEKLLQATEERVQGIPGSSYRRLVERCYQEKPKDPTIRREARKVRTAEALRTARVCMTLQLGTEGAAAKASYQAALAAAQEVGVSDAALAPAREAFDVYAMRERVAAAAAASSTTSDTPRAKSAGSNQPFIRPPIVDKLNARLRYLRGLETDRKEIATATQGYTSHKKLEAEGALNRKMIVYGQLCRPCYGRGLLIDGNGSKVTLRPCNVCAGKGVNSSWQGETPTADYGSFTEITVPRSALDL